MALRRATSGTAKTLVGRAARGVATSWVGERLGLDWLVKQIGPDETTDRIEAAEYAIRDPVVLKIVETLRAEGHNIIALNIGDPGANQGAYGLLPPKRVTDAAAEVVRGGKATGYADSPGVTAARQAIAEYSRRSGILDSREDNVFVGQGVSEIMDFYCKVRLQRGRNLVVPRPYYPLYGALVNLYSGRIRYYDVDPKTGAPNIEQLKRQINKNTVGVVVINPNNPLGTVLNRTQLEQIVDVVGKKGGNKVPILADEIYEGTGYDPHIPIASLTDKVPVHTFSGLSKKYGYPGARVAWMLTSNVESDNLHNGILKLSGMRLSANPIQHAIPAALLEDGGRPNGTYIRKLDERRLYAHRRLREMPGVEIGSEPKAAFYLFPRITGAGKKPLPWKTDKEFQLDLLKTTGVLIVPGSGFGMKPEDMHFRVVTLPDVKTQKEAYDRIETFVKQRLGIQKSA